MVMTPLLDKALRVRVPDEEQQQEEQKPDESNQLVVSVSQDGQIAINSEKYTDDAYVEKLKRVVAAKPRGERLVFFTADDKAKYGRLVAALDGARKAGAEVLTMTTEPMAPATAANTATAVPTSTR
jgi:biopolymer transport protein ExbD